jgi:hypothetical protein
VAEIYLDYRFPMKGRVDENSSPLVAKTVAGSLG